MYRIKPNGNYNLVIADINVSINAVQTEGILIEKELFDMSSEAKKLVDSKLLLVEDADTVKKQAAQPNKNKEKNTEKAFVVQGKTNKSPEDVFIKEVNENKDKNSIKVEQVDSLTKEVKDDIATKAVVAEPKGEDTVEEKQVESKVQVEETPKVKPTPKVKTPNEKAPATKKPAPKKEVTKK